MKVEQVRAILKDILLQISKVDPTVRPLPDSLDENLTLEEAGIGLDVFADLAQDLKIRLEGRNLGLHPYFVPNEFRYLTFGKLIEQIHKSLTAAIKNPIVVCVDDEEENLFVFNRKLGKRLNLKLFTEPLVALEFIQTNSDVALVITDEVMPRMGGNQLCDKVHETLPHIQFILITGNPNQDDDLLHKTLRHKRFYEFIQKPLDLDGKGEEYFKLISDVLGKK